MGEACIRGNVSHGDGVYRSTDGGKTWSHLGLAATRNIGQVRIDPRDPDTAFVAALGHAHGPNPERGIFRTRDGGKTWKKVLSRGTKAGGIDLSIDPTNPRIVYATLWEAIPHGDNHDMWIDPKDPLRIIEGNDGGATVSFNGGASWSSLYNQPTAEYYHITADTRAPYRLYAAQQDNSSISSPTRVSLSGILWQDCYEVGGGEAGHIAVRPDDPNVVFAADHAGLLTRYDHRTRHVRQTNVWPEATSGIAAKDIKYRFNWPA